jgi:hypothetical protein
MIDIKAARELCEQATFHLTGNEMDEDLKILVDQAAMLPVALDRIEVLEGKIAASAACLDCVEKMFRIAELEAANQKLKDALVEERAMQRTGNILWRAVCPESQERYRDMAREQLSREIPEIFGEGKA